MAALSANQCGFTDTNNGAPCTHRVAAGGTRCAAGHRVVTRAADLPDPSHEPTAEIPVVEPALDLDELHESAATEASAADTPSEGSAEPPKQPRVSKRAELRTNFRGRLTTKGGDLTAEDLLAYQSGGGSLEKANLNSVCLMGEDLTGFSFPKAKFHRANLAGCQGEDVSFVGARLWATQLYGAEFIGTPGVTGRPNFHRTELLEADLTRAKIHNADCSWACFRGANLTNASLQGSDLSNSDFTGATLKDCDFLGAKLDGARFDEGCEPAGFADVVRKRKTKAPTPTPAVEADTST